MRRLLVVLFVLFAVPAIARADNPSLIEARKAVDEIRYDDARALLVQALKQGGNSPEELVEIYRLSAATAAVLGPPDLADQYYRRMLALDPDATLSPDASPRLRDPFVAAQAYMAAQQRFEARVTGTEQGVSVSIVDPLGMVVAVATLDGGELRNKQPYSGQPLVLADASGEVVLLDENGNFLREIALPSRPVAAETAAEAHTPLMRRSITWAIPAVLFAGATTYLFIDAERTQTRLDNIISTSPMYFYDEAETERRRWRVDTIGAWIGVGATLTFTTVAIVMAASKPTPVRIAPSVGTDHASLQVQANF